MSAGADTKRQLEKAAWATLISCIAITPLAVTKFPFMSTPLTLDAFVFPQNVVLATGVALALALWGAAFWAGQTTLFVCRSMIAFGLFTGWAAVATVAAYEPLRSLFGGSLSALSLVSIVAYSALLFLAVQLVDSRQRIKTLTWSVVFTATIVGLLALLQQLFDVNVFGLPVVETYMTGRGFATIGNPDHLGTFLVLPTVLSAFLLLFEHDGRERIAAGCCYAVLLAALTGTLTRGAWVAILTGGIVGVVLLWRAWRKDTNSTRVGVVLAMTVAVVAIALVASDSADLARRFSAQTAPSDAGSATGVLNAASSRRIEIWWSSLRIVSQRPLTGTGPAAFELGWYPNAIDPTSGGGKGAFADDPHSLILYVVATTGLPGLLAYLVATLSALFIGWKNAVRLARSGPPSGTGLHYLAWFVAAVSLQVGLLVGAVTPPIVMYAYLSLAVLVRPSAHPVASTGAGLAGGSQGRRAAGSASIALAVLLVAAIFKPLAAEFTMADTFRNVPLSEVSGAAHSVPWNMSIQKAYFNLWLTQVNRALTSGVASARGDVEALVAGLTAAEAMQPREYYYPALRAQVLAEASSRLGEPTYAKAAIQAADDALAIMPAEITTRVNKALALSDLGRYDEMAETLAGYWENELSSVYPGILYAQALALSGRGQQAEETFSEIKLRFPAASESISQARQQVSGLLQQK
jgi:O-antigen ligase